MLPQLDRRLRGKQGLRDEIEIHQSVEQPGDGIFKSLRNLTSPAGGLILRPIDHPVGFDRVDHSDADLRRPPGQRGIDPGEVVADEPVALPPRGLPGDRGGIIALRLPRHRHPGKVGNPYRHTERGLPVPLPLVDGEVAVPVGDAVEFAQHAAATVLVRGALRLFGGGKFHPVTEHVDAGQLKGAVAAHRLAERRGLGFERRLRHHMAGQPQVVRLAPLADGVGEGGGEPFRHMVMVAVAGKRPGAAGQLPDQFRQSRQKLRAVGGPVALRQVVGVGQDHILPLTGELEDRLEGKLRFVGKNRRNRPPELLPGTFCIRLVGHLDKAADGGGVERVDVGFIVEPALFASNHPVEVEFFEPFARSLLLADHPGFGETTIGVEPDRIAAEQLPGVVVGRVGRFRAPVGGEEQITGAELRLARDDAARRAGGPAVLVVEPGKHRIALRNVDAFPDHRHELRTEIGGGQPGTRVHVKAPHPHLAERGDLAADLLPVQFAVPRPERRVAIERTRCAEQLFQILLLVGGV